MVGPFEIVRTDGHTYIVLVAGLPDTVSSDHVTWAPPPTGQEPNGDGWTVPDVAVSEGDGTDRPAFVWDCVLTNEVDDDGDLWLKVRWWAYGPEKDSWEHARKFDPRRVSQLCRRKRLPGPGELAAFLCWCPVRGPCCEVPERPLRAQDWPSSFVPPGVSLRRLHLSPLAGWRRADQVNSIQDGPHRLSTCESLDRPNGRNGMPLHVKGLSRLNCLGLVTPCCLKTDAIKLYVVAVKESRTLYDYMHRLQRKTNPRYTTDTPAKPNGGENKPALTPGQFVVKEC